MVKKDVHSPHLGPLHAHYTKYYLKTKTKCNSLQMAAFVLELVKYLMMATAGCLVALFAYLLRPRTVVISAADSPDGQEHVVLRAPVLSMAGVHVQHDLDARLERELAIERAEARLRQLLAESAVQCEEDTVDPLPKYSLYGDESNVHLDLESRLAVIIDQLESGGVVISSVRPVLASAGTPIVTPTDSVAVGSVPSTPTLSGPAATSVVDPAVPGVVPDASGVPIVRLTMSLPPPPKYDAADLVGVLLEATALVAPMLPAAPPSSPCLSLATLEIDDAELHRFAPVVVA